MLTVFVVTLATCQVLELWRHGSIFAGARARLELYTGLLSQLLLCTFCLTTYVAMLITVVGVVIPRVYPDTWVATFCFYTVFGLAAARSANLINDITHAYSRTPRNGLSNE
jgi:uncharacterized membrane protein